MQGVLDHIHMYTCTHIHMCRTFSTMTLSTQLPTVKTSSTAQATAVCSLSWKLHHPRAPQQLRKAIWEVHHSSHLAWVHPQLLEWSWGASVGYWFLPFLGGVYGKECEYVCVSVNNKMCYLWWLHIYICCQYHTYIPVLDWLIPCACAGEDHKRKVVEISKLAGLS